MKRQPTIEHALSRLRRLGVALTLACSAGAVMAGEGSALVTSFSYAVSGGTLTWLDPYQSFQATALNGGGLLGSKSDSFSTNDYEPMIVGANTTGAAAGVSTTDPQVFWADASTTSTTGPAATPRNQGNASATQSGGFMLSEDGTVTFTVGYSLSAASASGNPIDDFSTAFLHFNLANSDGSSGGDLSSLVQSFDTASGISSKTGQFSLTVALAAGEEGFYTLDGSAVSFSPVVVAVPEPGEWALMGAGLLAMASMLRRRRRQDRSRKMTKHLSIRALAASIALAAIGSAHAQDTTPINSNLPPGALPTSWDPTYNVCRGPDPACYHDWVGPTRQNRVLIYTRTAGPRHASLGPALAAGLNPPLSAANVTQTALINWLAAAGIVADWTEDASVLGSASLSKYKAVIFASNSRDALQKHGSAVDPTLAVNTTTSAYLDAAKVNLRQYMRAGGGFVAIHNAFGTEYNWPWYEGLLGNANYYDHGPYQNGTVQVVNHGDASVAGLPVRWEFKDEWYNLVPYPTNVNFLATVDESTMATKNVGHPGHGRFHPVAWCQYYDGGRAFLTTLGHDITAWTDGSGGAGQSQFKQLIVNGIKSAMGLTPFCTK